VSEQYDDMVKIWREKLSTSDFIDLGRVSKVLDIDYLIDIVFKQQVPLDYQKIKQSLMEFEIPVTHLKSGKVHYKSPKDDDLFELLRATKAVPGAYGKAITLSDGQQYIDGSNSS
jgi:predicted patatin/cPLA2 family phospholipase